ncbi:hypothetical protein J7T55_012486 [Diaporthe amygdali]|uniref:uncharacterized protein n=1 Tax=Phomopsis amygdali TaxID=1214568 RepID=UPI0022FDCEDD|nr:uncharacterized protein J7T55_012486 [Diaporthe amygdali]KAJ0124013.1 hypothetical protein J7T55_012486 [Diaporthe amygdali]
MGVSENIGVHRDIRERGQAQDPREDGQQNTARRDGNKDTTKRAKRQLFIIQRMKMSGMRSENEMVDASELIEALTENIKVTTEKIQEALSFIEALPATVDGKASS